MYHHYCRGNYGGDWSRIVLVEFKDQPELGVWDMEPPIKHQTWVIIRATPETPSGLVALADCATISVRRSLLRQHRPTQEERLF